jgi:flagellar basal body-associated protein FliL
MRRILIIIASIIVVLGIALVLYIVFFGTPAAHLTVNTSDPFADTGSGAATQATGQVGTAGSAGTVVAPNLIDNTSKYNVFEHIECIFEHSRIGSADCDTNK